MKIIFSPYFVPVLLGSLILFWVVAKKDSHRLVLLSAISFVVIAFLHPLFACICALIILLVHLIARNVQTKKLSVAWSILITISAAILIIGIAKYGKNVWVAIFPYDSSSWLASLAMPIGVSYFSFRIVQYVFEHCRGTLKNESILKLYAYLLFIPTFAAGPIESFRGFYDNRNLIFEFDLFYSGLRRVLTGYFKKMIILEALLNHNIFVTFCSHFTSYPIQTQGLHPLSPFWYVSLVFIKAYIDLSAYSDIAIGISRMFGFRILENFDSPLLQKNLGLFWRSWHISLSNWCRNNVYFPIFGATKKPWLGLYASMLVMGLWHYVNLNWFFWGLYHATGLIVVNKWELFKRKHKKIRKNVNKWYFSPIGILLTFIFVALGYSFVSTHSFSHGTSIFFASVLGITKWIAGF